MITRELESTSTAIYVRVSTEEQAKEGYSIRAQIDKLTNYCQIKDWELYKVYIDEGISGKNIIERPALNDLIADVKAKRVNNVLVYKIDRLTRSTRDLIQLTDLFNEQGCGFNSLMENIDTGTASGRMFLKIIGIFAEFERENLIERITVAYEKKAKEGYANTSFAIPYGYRREKGVLDITINEEESHIVKEIFNMYLEKHQSFNAIARELNLRKIKSNHNTKWSASSVGYILKNPLYAGKIRYSVTDKNRYFENDGRHQAIVTEEVFNKVQRKLAKMQKTIKKRPREENYYCGTLRCALCGSKMTTHGQYSRDKAKYYNSYKCRGMLEGKCKAGSISHTKLDIVFNDYVNNIKDFVVESIVSIENNASSNEEKATLKASYEVSLSKILKKEKDIMKLYLNDEIPFDEYNKMLLLLRNDIKAYEDRINELEEDEEPNVEIKINDIITNLKENWNSLTNLEKMQFLQTYFEAIYIVVKVDPETKKRQIIIKKVEFHKYCLLS